MFRAQKKRVSERTNFGAEIVRESEYPDRLNLYTTPPLAEITLDEFEEWAIDRLRVLTEIETCLYKDRNYKATESALKPKLDTYLPLSPPTTRAVKANVLEAERKKDHYSHFILRLAFCRTEELRRRFVKAETMLFRIRYASADAAEQRALIERYNFGWTQVTEQERRELGDCLAESETYFKVPFERVCELVEARRVFVKRGMAYVLESQQLSLILTEFSDKLERALEMTARALPRLDEDDRLIPILNHLSSGYVAPEYNPEDNFDGDAIKAAHVDSLVRHFPVCMSTLHAALRKDQHLKYAGRQQYGLFLKGIGLSVNEALTFWRQSFAKFTDDQFNKEYRYNIRHNYGLEGARKNYKPMSCDQILNNAPGSGEHHGCPFRHFSEDNLIYALERIGVADRGVLAAVREDKRKTQFHVACTRVFETLHKAPGVKPTVGLAPGLDTITHPNLYFDRSLKFHRQVAEIDGADAAGL